MNSRAMWTIFLPILLGLSNFNTFEASRPSISFLVEGENLMIAQSTENTEINLLILSNFSKEEALEKLKLIRDKLDLFPAIPGVNETAVIKQKIVPIVTSIRKIFPQLFKLITDLALYKDETKEIPHSNIKCKISLPSFSTAKIVEVLNQITYTQDQIEMDADSTRITDKSVLREIVSALLTTEDLIEDLKETALNRKRIITTLLEQSIPNELTSFLETLTCVESGNLESLEIIECLKEKNGLSCDLTLKAFKNTQELTTWVPVSYKGAQLMGKLKNQIFAKNAEGVLGLISCNTEIKNTKTKYLTDKECSFEPLDHKCSYSLDRLVLNDILSHCNFTVYTPKLVTRVKDGLLVMQETNDLEINEYSLDRSSKRTITPDLPMLIKTDRLIEIKTRTQIKKYTPKFSNIERTIYYSLLDKQFQDTLLSTAIWQDFTRNINYKDGIDYGLISAFTVMMPITLGLFIAYCKRSDIYESVKQVRKKKWFKRSKRTVRPEKENYQINRSILKNPDLDIFKIERTSSH